MNIYNFGNGEIFEVVDQLMLEGSNGYKIKVSRFISPNRPDYRFNDDVFFTVSFAAWSRKKEVSEDEFCEEIKRSVSESWKPLCEKVRGGYQYAIELNQLQISTRDSFIKTPTLGAWSDFRDKL
jgi:hypothetical protein